jgi:hypothetical protein
MPQTLYDIQYVRSQFAKSYGHINLQELSDEDVIAYLQRDYIKNLAFTRQLDLLSDYVLANNLADVQE